jgi:thiosulfate/3-mercaptopyruvate sulfurtransferase
MKQKNKNFFIPMILALMFIFVSSVTSFAGYKGFVRDDSLITPQQLKELIDKKDPNLVILAVAKTTDYRTGHIPGALQIWRGDYEPAKDKPYPYGGMILNRTEFEKFARDLGINNDSTVVIYDHKYDATRVWWAFFLYGKRDCKVLDGGFQGWKKAGYDTKILAPDKPKQGNFVAKPPLAGWTASMDEVWQAKTNPEMQVWDTREKNEWTGKKLKKGAFRKGRVPWAKFLNWKEFKMPVAEGEKPTAFKTADEIQKVIEKFGMDKNKYQIFYCQSAVRTTTEIFALYLMGWDISKLHNYDGSWIQWSYFKENPVVCEECK